MPGIYLFIATIAVVIATLILPFTPVGKIFDFVSLPMSFMMILGIIMALYIFTAELTKKIFYKKINY
jgi:Mg2+-importing ATPase